MITIELSKDEIKELNAYYTGFGARARFRALAKIAGMQ